jgi:hypothetical protein
VASTAACGPRAPVAARMRSRRLLGRSLTRPGRHDPRGAADLVVAVATGSAIPQAFLGQTVRGEPRTRPVRISAKQSR